MKKLNKLMEENAGKVILACCALAFAILYVHAYAQPSQYWTRDAAVQVTATATVAITDLRGTVTDGWDKIVVHNKDASVWVGTYPEVNGRRSDANGVDTFAEMTVFIPPNGSREIKDENVVFLRIIAETGSADLIVEREKRN